MADFASGNSESHLIGAARRDAVPAAPAESVTASTGAGVIGQSIGPYKLLSILGEGGMGTVYLAEQTQPVRRRVAFKIIKLGMDTRSVIARFEAERQALAMMDHPNVAKVFDAGTTEQGRPYFVMEHVAGIPITEHCDRHRLNIRQRLELFIPVCEAIQHAHQKGIIHRDIKPSNVLVSVSDGHAISKVIDFGVAKATAAHLTEKTLFTEQGQLIGTPAYMSPEQAEMTAQDIDTRSDIYSLGVLLYELLTGALPFDAKTLRRLAFNEIQRIIRDVEPVKPSTRLSGLASSPLASIPNELSDGESVGTVIAQQRQTDPRSLVKSLRGDLDWITMKCLEKDRARRYESANGLAMEIRRHLNNEPVLAGPPGAGYRARKFVRRNRAAVIAATLIATALVFGIIGTSIGFARAVAARRAEAEQRRVAQTSARKSEQVAKFLTEMLEGVNPANAQGRDTTLLREILEKANKRARTELPDQPEVEAAILLPIGRVYYQIYELEKAEEIYSEILRLRRLAFGNEHVDVAYSIHDLAETRYAHGDMDGAEKMEKEALAMRQRLLGDNHPDVAWSLNRLAMIKHMRNQLSEAEELYGKALTIMRHVHGGDHFDVATMLNNVSMVLRLRGATKESEKMLREAIEMQRRVMGNLHPMTAQHIDNLATLLWMRGELAEAESLCREAVNIQTRIDGASHPDTLKDMDDLAMVLQNEGKVEETEAVLREAVTAASAGPPENQNQTLLLTRRLAEVLDGRGQHDEAQRLARKVVDAYLTQHDPSPKVAAYAYSTLIETLSDAGKAVEAARELHNELEWLHKKLSPDDPRLASALAQTACVLLRIHEYAKSEPILRECLEICEKKAFPNKHDQACLKCTSTSMLGEAVAESTQPIHSNANGKFAVYSSSQSTEVAVVGGSKWSNTAELVVRFDEAERLLLGSYMDIKEMPYIYWPFGVSRSDCKRRALERIVRLYEIRHDAEPNKGYDTKAAEWRRKLADYQATMHPATTQPSGTTRAGTSGPIGETYLTSSAPATKN